MPEIRIIEDKGNGETMLIQVLWGHFNDIFSDGDGKPLGAVERRLGVVTGHLSLCSVFERLSCMNV